MGRSGYSDDIDDQWAMIRWRGAVAQAIRGQRGQTMLRALLAALDAMPVKRLIGAELVDSHGEFCALGVLGASRGIDLTGLNTEDWARLAATFGVSEALVREVMFINDGDYEYEMLSPERRWAEVRQWVVSQFRTGVAPL